MENEGPSQCENFERAVKENQNGLQCDLCEKLHHSGCEIVKAEDDRLLESEDSDSQWYCRSCRGQLKNRKEENRKLRAANKSLTMENETC